MAHAKRGESRWLVCFFGDDELAIRERSRGRYRTWCEEVGGDDHEVIDATASNSSEALTALARLREALQTLPFFGTGKVVWFRDCTFLGEEKVAASAAVTEALGDLAGELGSCLSSQLRLVISAGKVDKRRSFYKALDRLGELVPLAGLSAEDRDWPAQAAALCEAHLAVLGKRADAEVIQEIVARVGPHTRQLYSELEKLSLYVGSEERIGLDAVGAVVTRNRQAQAFAVGDALGDRQVVRLLRALDEELWEARSNAQRSEVGILYGLVSKVRALLFMRGLIDQGVISATKDFSRFRAQLAGIAAEGLPADKRWNPLVANPYVLFKAMQQVRSYRADELVRAMQVLLEANRRLVSTGADEAWVMQRAVLQIALPSDGSASQSR